MQLSVKHLNDMKRKDFVRLATLSGTYFGITGHIRGENRSFYNTSIGITVAELQQFLVSLTTIPLRTVDRIIIGDPDRLISSVGIGTGCICDPMEFADLKPDVFIAIDDVVRTWIQTAFASDTGHPLIVVNHGTTEEMGMRMLNHLIKQKFPEIETFHLNQGCTYKWITG